MAHNARTRLDGEWIPGFEPIESDWESLFDKVFRGINGDRGGAYKLLGKWTIAGSGLQVTGPTKLVYGGQIDTGHPNSRFVIRDGAWPLLVGDHVGKIRKLVQSFDRAVSNRMYLWSRIHPYGGLGSVALSCRLTHATQIERPELFLPLRVHDGATLNKVTFHYRVSRERTAAPVSMPQFRVLRRSLNGLSIVPLKTTTDGKGFDSPELVTSGADWYDSGQPKTFEYVCDQNHVINTSQFSYVAHVIEEQGAVDASQPFDGTVFVERKEDAFAASQGSFTSNPDGLTGVIDRLLVVDTDAILATNNPDLASVNAGIWYDDSGWLRTLDLANPADFTPGFIVRVLHGTKNSESCWQYDMPAPARPLAGASGGSAILNARLLIKPAEPRGNIYHSAVTEFAVSDLRFQ